MKKLIVIVLVILVGLATAAPLTLTAQASDPLPPQLAYVDAQLDIFVPLVASFQADYFNSHGRYYQALGSHSVVPVGAEAATGLENHPTDEDTTLAPLWDYTGLPASIAWSFEINTAVTPRGPGWAITIKTDVDGQLWQRTFNYIPGWNDSPWEQVLLDE